MNEIDINQFDLTHINNELYYPWIMTDPLAKLKRRRDAIAQQIADFTSKIDGLRAEDADLARAEAVMERFIDDDVFYPASIQVDPPSPPKTEGRGKPPGTPTTPVMITWLLKKAIAEGKSGLEPREIQMEIAKRWWPAVKSEDVGPTMWRMWKEGRLSKDGALYALPTKTGIEEAAALPWDKEKTTASD